MLWLVKLKLGLLHDFISKRDYNCDSDHFFVQFKIKQKLIPVKTEKYKV